MENFQGQESIIVQNFYIVSNPLLGDKFFYITSSKLINLCNHIARQIKVRNYVFVPISTTKLEISKVFQIRL